MKETFLNAKRFFNQTREEDEVSSPPLLIESQYNVTNYEQIYQQVMNDPMFKNQHPSPPQSKNPSLGDYRMTLKNNLKPTLVGHLPDVHASDKLLLANLYEKSIADLPNSIKHMVTTGSRDFVVYDSVKEPIQKKVPTLDPSTFQDLAYEIDNKDSATGNQPLSARGSKKNSQRQSALKEPIDPLNVDMDEAQSIIDREYDPTAHKDFILQTVVDASTAGLFDDSSDSIIKHDPIVDPLLPEYELKDSYISSHTHVAIAPLSLSFKLFQSSSVCAEEIFCSATIYDTTNDNDCTKVTETFTFKFGTSNNEQYKMLFSLPALHDNLVILLKFCRKYEGKYSDSMNDLFLKGEKTSEKDITNVNSKITKALGSVDGYYSYFGWAATSVKSLIKDGLISQILFLSGNSKDQSLLQLFKVPDSKRTKVIPGSAFFHAKEMPEIGHTQRQFASPNRRVVTTSNGPENMNAVKCLENTDKLGLELENTCFVQLQTGSFSKDLQNAQVVISLCEEDRDVEQEGLKSFFPFVSSLSSELHTSASSLISAKNSSPDFSEEFRFLVPAKAHKPYHLLFRFYNLTSSDNLVKNRKLVAYSYIKLFNEQKQIIKGSFTLNLYKLKSSGKTCNYFEPSDRKLQGSTLTFKFIPRCISYPTDAEGTLDVFLNYLNSTDDYKSVNKELYVTATNALVELHPNLSSYIPMALDQLFEVIEVNSDKEIQLITFKVIMRLVNKFRSWGPSLIPIYIRYYFSNRNISDSLLSLISTYLESSNQLEQAISLCCGWFLFALPFKAILLRLDLKRNSPLTKNANIPSKTLTLISDLLLKSMEKFFQFGHKNAKHMSGLVGAFLMRSLSLASTKTVMSLVTQFNAMLGRLPGRTAEEISDLQLLLFQNFLTYRDYMLLFLPQKTEDAMKITKDPRMLEQRISLSTYNHFIYTAFIDVVIKSLDNPVYRVRMKAISVFRDFLVRTTWDERYQVPEFRERLFQVHFEFIQKLLDILEEWKTHCHKQLHHLQVELSQIQKKVAEVATDTKLLKMRLSEQKESEVVTSLGEELVSFATLSSTLEKSMFKTSKELQKQELRVKEEMRNIFGCVVHILQGMKPDLISKWFCFEKLDPTKRLRFIQVIQNILLGFEYEGARQLYMIYGMMFTKSSVDSGSDSTRTPRPSVVHKISTDSVRGHKKTNSFGGKTRRSTQIEDSSSSSQFSKMKSMLTGFQIFAGKNENNERAKIVQKKVTPIKLSLIPLSPDQESNTFEDNQLIESKILIEKYVTLEASFYSLWLLSKLVKDLDKKQLDTQHSRSFKQIVTRTLLYFLHLGQCDYFVLILMAYLRAYLVQSISEVNSASLEHVNMFCEGLMCLCSSSVWMVREHAIPTLYVLVRTIYMVSKTIAPAQVTCIVALTRYLQRTGADMNLVKSIRGIAQYARTDDTKQLTKETFSKDLQQLCDQLETLLKNIRAVNQSSSGLDTQKTEELMWSIANQYEAIPELKVMWLRQLASLHMKNKQHAEYVQCCLHMIALLLENMKGSKFLEGLPLNNFYDLNPSYLNKYKGSSKANTVNSLPNISEYSEDGLLTLFRAAISGFEQAEQYEHAIQLLKLLLVIFEGKFDMLNMSKIYEAIGKMMKSVHECETLNPRQYSTYYRVNFFGKEWGDDLDNKQFIYKMPKLFKLFMMTNKLKEAFASDVELITTPGKVKLETLDPSKRYIQFNHVKPYSPGNQNGSIFSSGTQNTRRKTHFESNMNLNQFYFASAFSKDSEKLSDKATEVYKKKVIVTVDGLFPDTRTRLPIVKKEKIILTPIEAAIENMESQIQKLEETLQQNPPDISQLQLVLQGSVRAGVNGGPKEIVQSYLASAERSKYKKEFVQQLNEQCHYFLLLCEEAVKIDGRYAKSSQRSMHLELEKSFVDTKNLMLAHLETTGKTTQMLQDYQSFDNRAGTSTTTTLTRGPSIQSLVGGEDHVMLDQYPNNPDGIPQNRFYRHAVQRKFSQNPS